jgi:hypothetical protein
MPGGLAVKRFSLPWRACCTRSHSRLRSLSLLKATTWLISESSAAPADTINPALPTKWETP